MIKNEEGRLEVVMLVEKMTSGSSGRRACQQGSLVKGGYHAIDNRTQLLEYESHSKLFVTCSAFKEWGVTVGFFPCYTNISFLKLVRHDSSIHHLNIENDMLTN